MNTRLVGLGLMMAPSMALAHEGHGGVGLFHHAMNLLPLVAVAAAIVVGWRLYTKR